MGAKQPVPYFAPWDSVPIVFIDFETTGIRVGVDRAVEVGVARFERGQLVGKAGTLLDPAMPIPAESTAVHSITDAMVAGMPSVGDFFAGSEVKALLDGAQPGAYNAGFDRWFTPPWALADWTWPWLDALTLVRDVDRYVKGAGRHKLPATCARHGVPLLSAHRADDDARAAGELFFKLMRKKERAEYGRDEQPLHIGALLGWMRAQDAAQWTDFNSWLARQPAREDAAP